MGTRKHVCFNWNSDGGDYGREVQISYVAVDNKSNMAKHLCIRRNTYSFSFSIVELLIVIKYLVKRYIAV